MRKMLLRPVLWLGSALILMLAAPVYILLLVIRGVYALIDRAVRIIRP
ncbi:MAG: hypothetical protein IJG63_09120 [Oscillospiraceae bacterium]|nr:hypothetical protein [Oscillospiraceae bacterium]